MSSRPGRAEVFRYVQHDWDADSRRLLCRYDLDGETFEEAFTFTPTDADLALGTAPDPEDLEAAFRLVFLLAGMSYYKAGAPPVVDLGTTATTASERELLRASLVEGLGEYAHKNQLDLSDVRFEGPTATPAPVGPPPAEPVIGPTAATSSRRTGAAAAHGPTASIGNPVVVAAERRVNSVSRHSSGPLASDHQPRSRVPPIRRNR